MPHHRLRTDPRNRGVSELRQAVRPLESGIAGSGVIPQTRETRVETVTDSWHPR
jgi:hypothetical protein